MTGASADAETGSRASTEPSSTVSALSGFDPARLLELAERCEQATGPDTYLDEAIMDALFEARPFVQLADAPEGTGFRAWRVNGQTQSAYRYTASLDAAVTLVPAGWLVSEMFERNASGEWNWRWKVSLWRWDTDGSVTGIARQAHDKPCAPALALCAAALRAHAASAIEAPSGVETGNTDSTEGESAAREAGDAQ